MKIIKQEAHLLDTAGMSEYQIIEKVGRTCYKSEDKITDDSATKFVASLVKSGHHAMIEFGFIYLKLTEIDFAEWFIMNKPDFIRNIDNYVVGNMRAFYDWYKGLLDGEWFFGPDADHGFIDLLQTLSMAYPDVYRDLYDKIHEKFEPTYDDSDCPEPDEVNDPFKLMTAEEFYADYKQSGCIPNLLKYITPHIVMFRTNRGVSHEMVRHRLCTSYAMESTRYCNYSKGKFGGELTFIEPMNEIRDNPEAYERWLQDTKDDEESYMWFVKQGISAQAARGRLPHDIKADLWVCTFEDEWQHIFNLRMHGTTGAPHPQIKELMELAYLQLVEASEGRLK